MAERPYDVLPGDHGTRIQVNTHGSYILRVPRLNRGTAFTHEQRVELGLEGLLPERVTPLEGQLHRTYTRFLRAGSAVEKFAYLHALRDRNTVLFYRLLSEHLDEMMPIVYTPTIGEAIQEFSLWYQRVNGVFLSIDAPERIESSLRATGKTAEDVDLLIVTDSEGILGIGDQGVGGILICIGKKSLYTAAAGMDPDRMVPIVLDVGTNNLSLLNDDLYLGLRHARVRGERYDAFLAAFVEAAQKVFPNAMVHWEDFGADNAHRILGTYRDEICTFNDDVQGTAAVVAAAVMSGVRAKGERLRDQRFVISGAGTAGIGIADLLVDLLQQEGLDEQGARSLFWATTSRGLVTDDATKRFRDFQRRYQRSSAEVASWTVEDAGRIGLADVVANVHPTVLIGTSGQTGSFTEAIVKDMAAHVERPLIMPLSNPTTLAEATPGHIIEWTEGRALIATGSPFAPVTYDGVTYDIAQANNALVFPGLGLGVAVCRATRVTDGMIAATAQAVASLVNFRKAGQSLLPSVRDLRRVSANVAIAVARQAELDGVAQNPLHDPVQQIFEAMWQPVYPELIYNERVVATEEQ